MNRADLSPAQSLAVLTRGRDACVDATAGSGKTRVLIERFASLLVDDRVPLERVVAITFTRSATSQMRSRLARRLRELGRHDLSCEASAARIDTIHGFCAGLIASNALEAVAASDGDVLDAARSRELLRASVNRALVELAETEAGRLLDRHLERRFGDMALVDLISDAIESARGRGIPFRRLDEAFPTRVEGLAEEIASAAGTMLSDPEIRGAARTKAETLAALDLQRAVESSELERTFSKLGEAVNATNRKGLSKKASAALLGIRELLTELGSHVAERAAQAVRSALAELIRLSAEKYGAAKRAIGRVDFSDLEIGAHDLLASDAGVLSKVRSGVDHLLVDEYQDTSPIQESIIRMIAPPGGLFVVGDEMQSIYGFRNADVEVLRRARQSCRERGVVVSLRETYRNPPSVCAFVNGLFGAEHGEVLRASGAAAHVQGTVELFIANAPLIDDGREIEARWLAARIRELVDGDTTVRDENAGGRRRLSYGDVMALARSHGGTDALRAAFAEYDVPALFRGGRGFAETREVSDAMALLRVIADPADSYSCAVVIRGPIVGLSDDGLTALVAARGQGALWESWRSGDGLDGDERDRAEGAAALIERLRADAARLSLGELVSRAIVDSRLFARCGAGGRRAQARANLERLIHLAESEWAAGSSLPDFVARMASGNRELDSQATLRPVSAVRVSTIHDAKGLEAPVVAVVDTARGERNKNRPIVVSRDGHLGYEVTFPGIGRLKTPSLESIREETARHEREEAQRLFYVACTRSLQHLILTGTASSGFSLKHGDDSKTWLERVCATFGIDPGSGPRTVAIDGCRLDVHVADEAPNSGKFTRRATARERRDYARLLQFPSKPSAVYGREVESVTALVECARCPQRYLLTHLLASPEISEIDARTVEGRDRRGLGLLVHRAIQLGVRKTDDLVELARTLGADASLVDAASVMLRRFDGSELGASATESEYELELTARVEDATVRGRIDILIEHGDEYFVVDVKTSGRDTPDGDAHVAQVQAYSLMTTELRGAPPARALIAYLGSGDVVEVDVAGEALERAHTRLVDTIRLIRAGRFDPPPAPPCAHCRALGRCAYATVSPLHGEPPSDILR